MYKNVTITKKIKPTSIKPAVIGMGYIGFPIFQRLARKLPVIGFDTSKRRVKNLKNGYDFNEFPKKRFFKNNNMIFSNDEKCLLKANFFIVCVPTPVKKNNQPDLSYLISASKILSKFIKNGDIIFFESTVYPGVTYQCAQILEKESNLKNNKDFFVGYSPERINPGDKKKTIDKIVKVVAYESRLHIDRVKKIYNLVSKKIVFSKNILEAETSKVIENIQRDLNIGLFNEIFIVCKKLNINFYNVINLASTKWNFIKFKPGLVGGHCLPVDPYYFSFLAKKHKMNTEIILAGRKVNNSMVNYVIKRIKKEILYRKYKKKINILLLGATYKPNVPDIRNSLSLIIRDKLKSQKIKICDFYDPIVSDFDAKKFNIIKKNIEFNKYDIIILLVKHKVFENLLKNKNLDIIDIF